MVNSSPVPTCKSHSTVVGTSHRYICPEAGSGAIEKSESSLAILFVNPICRFVFCGARAWQPWPLLTLSWQLWMTWLPGAQTSDQQDFAQPQSPSWLSRCGQRSTHWQKNQGLELNNCQCISSQRARGWSEESCWVQWGVYPDVLRSKVTVFPTAKEAANMNKQTIL